jgi:outer membrane protein assembly factor BamA
MMSIFSRVLIALFFLYALPWSLRAETSTNGKRNYFHITQIDIVGLKRTEQSWLLEHLHLSSLPLDLNNNQLEQICEKLHNMRVFSYATTDVEETSPAHFKLKIIVEEKWTLIPVVRGQSGGGTPLFVLGAYETNLFGKIITFGGEARRYGNAPVGYMIYGKNHDRDPDYFFLGDEIKHFFRIRDFYDNSGTGLGAFHTTETSERIKFLFPSNRQMDWRWGGDFRLMQNKGEFEATSSVQDDKKQRLINLSGDRSWRSVPSLAIEYDDIVMDNILFDGKRLEAYLGVLAGANSFHQAIEAQFFYYKLLSHQWNYAAHIFWKSSDDDSLASQKFLGGFDSIRGIPDGDIFGSKSVYVNNELTWLCYQSHYIWVQQAVFVDAGMANDTWKEMFPSRRYSFGGGVRIAILQNYSLMLRIDYALSYYPYKTEGFSIGLNQFFQAYRPNLSD